MRKKATLLLVLALAFIALGATGQRPFTFVGLVFFAVFTVLLLRSRR